MAHSFSMFFPVRTTNTFFGHSFGKEILYFMELEVYFLWSQKSITGSYPEPHWSSSHPISCSLPYTIHILSTTNHLPQYYCSHQCCHSHISTVGLREYMCYGAWKPSNTSASEIIKKSKMAYVPGSSHLLILTEVL